MINYVLASFLTYFHSLFFIPSSIVSDIEKCKRNFLWGKGKDSMGLHPVAWEEVCKLKRFGGIGIKRIRDVDKALL